MPNLMRDSEHTIKARLKENVGSYRRSEGDGTSAKTYHQKEVWFFTKMEWDSWGRKYFEEAKK